MPNPDADSILDISALSSSLLAEQEVVPRALALARFVASLVPQSAISVYTLASNGTNDYWIPKATIGEATVHEQSIAAGSGILGSLLEDSTPVLRTASSVKREDYPHIDTRKTLLSLCYIPLVYNDSLLGALEILPFDSPADTAYGLIRGRLEQAGQLIGGNDLLIAAQAIAFGYTLVTDNQKEFARVAGLARENWLR